MALATPSRPDRSPAAVRSDRPARGKVPDVSELDALPHIKTVGRWGEPFNEDGKWRQALRHPDKLTAAHRANGLLPYLVTETEDELAALRGQQDALLTRLTKHEGGSQGVAADIHAGREP